jgi:hypothetical protein
VPLDRLDQSDGDSGMWELRLYVAGKTASPWQPSKTWSGLCKEAPRRKYTIEWWTS